MQAAVISTKPRPSNLLANRNLIRISFNIRLVSSIRTFCHIGKACRHHTKAMARNRLKTNTRKFGVKIIRERIAVQIGVQTLTIGRLWNKHSNKHKGSRLFSVVVTAVIRITINTSGHLANIRLRISSSTIRRSYNIRRIDRRLPNAEKVGFINIRGRIFTPNSTKHVTNATAGNKRRSIQF